MVGWMVGAFGSNGKTFIICNLGRKMINYEEMATILCDCEQIINSRPLTYLSEDSNELVALTPMMFLNEARSSEVMDLDQIESMGFDKRYEHRQEIRQELRDRFRKEYLSQLVHHNLRTSGHNKIKIGDIVLVEVENRKRINWPVAKVIELFPSCDGVVRSVKLSTNKKELTRAIQRLYLLEASGEDVKNMRNDVKKNTTEIVDLVEVDKRIEDERNMEKESSIEGEELIEEGTLVEEKEEVNKKTRSGKIVKQPERFGY